LRGGAQGEGGQRGGGELDEMAADEWHGLSPGSLEWNAADRQYAARQIMCQMN
jgi:hypothetical protein